MWDEDVLTQARSAKMDERMSLVSLLLEAVFLQMERCTLRHDALRLIVAALKACYQRSVADLQAEVAETQKKLGNLLRFLQEAFGKGTELSMAVNDLTVAPVATAFLGQFLSTDYFAASRDLLLHRQSEQLLHQIDLTGLV